MYAKRPHPSTREVSLLRKNGNVCPVLCLAVVRRREITPQRGRFPSLQVNDGVVSRPTSFVSTQSVVSARRVFTYTITATRDTCVTCSSGRAVKGTVGGSKRQQVYNGLNGKVVTISLSALTCLARVQGHLHRGYLTTLTLYNLGPVVVCGSKVTDERLIRLTIFIGVATGYRERLTTIMTGWLRSCRSLPREHESGV